MSKHAKVERLVVGSVATNCYIVVDNESQEALIIDPGDDAEFITDKLTQLKAHPVLIVATHGHFDHIMAARALQLAYGVPFFINKKDNFLVARMQESARHFLHVRDVDPPPKLTPLQAPSKVRAGETVLEVIPTPGHTPGSVCFYDAAGGHMFVGDTIFADGGVGRTDFSYSRPSVFGESITKILSYPVDTKLHPGHGKSTLIRYEKQHHKGA